MGRVGELDLSLKLSKEEEGQRLDAGWKRLPGLRLALGAKLPGYALGPPVCVLFEGWDASGKGGAIKRLVAPLDMRRGREQEDARATVVETVISASSTGCADQQIEPPAFRT
jgi:AMP-polyphosphate phosphotransferase